MYNVPWVSHLLATDRVLRETFALFWAKYMSKSEMVLETATGHKAGLKNKYARQETSALA